MTVDYSLHTRIMIQQDVPFCACQELLFSFFQATYNKPHSTAHRSRHPWSSRTSINFLRPRQAMSVSAEPSLPPLLSLPAETRDQIYNELLLDQPSCLTSLLTVNSRIYQEVRPWMFRRPITFNGQRAFHRWLSSVDPAFLTKVREIRFKLHDIDSEKLVGAFAEGLRRRRAHHGPEPVKNAYDEACRTELQGIRRALRQLKNLKIFTLLGNTSADPRPPANMVKTFIESIVLELPLTSFIIPHELLKYLDQANTFPVRQLRITDHAFIARPDFPKNEFSNVVDFKTCGGCHTISTISPLVGSHQRSLVRRLGNGHQR